MFSYLSSVGSKWFYQWRIGRNFFPFKTYRDNFGHKMTSEQDFSVCSKTFKLLILKRPFIPNQSCSDIKEIIWWYQITTRCGNYKVIGKLRYKYKHSWNPGLWLLNKEYIMQEFFDCYDARTHARRALAWVTVALSYCPDLN